MMVNVKKKMKMRKFTSFYFGKILSPPNFVLMTFHCSSKSSVSV